ncbi:glycosyltransferase family A protein [Deinococcus ficus]|uniref:glycosyltransferase family A protein n=1 Tax=Deinococcus ficus TaxID=317577 RepID=UPI000A05F42B|nr:glycosyltransferase family 2 protein [Deinococcus ficus]
MDLEAVNMLDANQNLGDLNYGCRDNFYDCEQELVSVLVPIYNHERYIEFCLNSIKSNDYDKIEIILIDDGSSDSSFAKASSWIEVNQSRFSRALLIQQDNQGLTKTLNRLVSLAEGEYIAFLASDDGLTQNSLSKRIDILKSNPEYRIAIGNANVIDTNSVIVSNDAISSLHGGSPSTLANPKKLAGEIIMHWSIPGPVMLAHKSVFADEYGMYNTQLKVEDRHWYIKMLARHKIYFINEPIAYYRIHESNTIYNPQKTLAMLQEIVTSDGENIVHHNGLNRLFLFLSYKRGFYYIRMKCRGGILDGILYTFFRTLCRIAVIINRRT